jgi:hypothetical protein
VEPRKSRGQSYPRQAAPQDAPVRRHPIVLISFRCQARRMARRIPQKGMCRGRHASSFPRQCTARACARAILRSPQPASTDETGIARPAACRWPSPSRKRVEPG